MSARPQDACFEDDSPGSRLPSTDGTRAPWVSQSHCEKCEGSQGTCRQSKTNVTLGRDGGAGLTARATGVFQGQTLSRQFCSCTSW